jgi:hypothetical protein
MFLLTFGAPALEELAMLDYLSMHVLYYRRRQPSGVRRDCSCI